MKKTLIILAAGLFISTVSSGTILIVEANPGVCGYYGVSESHNGGIDALGCYDPGYCDCRFEKPLTESSLTIPLNVDEANNEIRNIREKISAGMATGAVNGVFKSALGEVNWSLANGILHYRID